MARPPAEVVFADGDAARWRIVLRLYLGGAATLLVASLIFWLRARAGASSEAVLALAEPLPVLMTLAFTAGLLARAVLARDLSVDFAEAVRTRTPLLEAVASLLEAGRYEPGTRVATVTGRFGGLPVQVGAWVDPLRPPWDDELTCTVAFPCDRRARVRRGPARPGLAPLDQLRIAGDRAPPLDEEVAATLVRGFDELHVRAVVLSPEGMTLRLPATARLLSPTRQRRLLAFATALARQLGAVPLQVSATVRDSAARCPYCRTPVAEGDRSDCDACSTPHHPECLSEHGGCTLIGCRGGPARERERAR